MNPVKCRPTIPGEMIVGVLAELHPSERRVALVPSVISSLRKAGLEILVQQGAGERAGHSDSSYEQAGAQLTGNRNQIFASADLLLQVHGPGANYDPAHPDLKLLRSGQVVLGLLNPLGAPEYVRVLAESGATSFALELLPRVSRAQSMDALTSMATISGYKAALMAAAALPKMYPMMITAAGTITPARIFVIGAGVAGLQAIAGSRRLGAVVHAYDVRPAVKEQVETLGARFVELGLETAQAEAAGGYAKAMDEEFYRRQREKLAEVISESDVVITTAAVPGKKAPVLVTEEMIRKMRPGSIVIDLAAETGGNCELTRPGETIEAHGVVIMAPVNLSSTIPHHASLMYARNITAFLQNLVKEGKLDLNREDPIVSETLLTHQREVIHPGVRELLGLPAAASATERRSS